MERELKGFIHPRPQNTAQRMAVKKFTDLPPVDVCYIGAVGFYQNLIQPNAIAFTTNLYKINRIIKEKEALDRTQSSGEEDEFMDKELVELKLHQYLNFKDVFLKAVSNILPLYQPYNYKIEIKLGKENTFNYSPFCQ